MPETTHAIFAVRDGSARAKDFSDTIEKAKTKAGKKIVERSGERWPPFYTESYDHILRDAEDVEEHWNKMLAEAESVGLDAESDTVWVSPEFLA